MKIPSQLAHRTGILVLAVAVTATMPAVSQAGPEIVEVDYCGQIFTGKGILVRDLVCTGNIHHNPRAAVTIQKYGVLDLDGHIIWKEKGRQGVRCNDTCKVVGPGRIVSIDRAKAAVRADKKLTVTNVIVEGGWLRGVQARRGVRVIDSIVRGARDVGVTSDSRTATIINSEVYNNGFDENAVHGVGVRATRRAKILGSTISDNARFGVATPYNRSILEASSVSGNGLHVACGDEMTCADLHSKRLPTLFASSCGSSDRKRRNVPSGTYPGVTWGICDED